MSDVIKVEDLFGEVPKDYIPKNTTEIIAPAGEYKGSLTPYNIQFGNLENRQAMVQSTAEQWGRGIIKFGEQVTTGVIGGTIGTLYGLGSAIRNQDLNKFIDNDFNRTLDSWDDATREAFKNYRTTKEQERAWYQNLGTANFWAEDVLGGMAFTVAAVLTEVIASGVTAATLGAGAGLQAGATARLVARASKLLNKSDDALTAASAMRNVKGLGAANVADNLLVGGRRMVTGSAYESSIQARHLKDEAWGEELDKLGVKSKEELVAKYGAEKLAEIEDRINSLSNWVFAGNMALLSVSNAITLPKTFGVNSNAIKRFNDRYNVLSPTRMVGKEGSRKVAYDTWNKLQKGLYWTGKGLQRPVTEGLFEEGLQSFIDKAGLNYIASKYDKNGIEQAYSLMDTLSDTWAETYGSEFKNEFWKEVGIGMIIGLLGSPTFNINEGAKGFWQGSIIGGITGANDEIKKAGEVVDKLNSKGTFEAFANNLKNFNTETTVMSAQKEAAESGNVKKTKDAEATLLYNQASLRYATGTINSMVEEYHKALDELDTDNFNKNFGTNLTDKEVEARKKELKETIETQVNDAKDSIRLAEKYLGQSGFVGEDGNSLSNKELIEALGYDFYMTKDLDKREAKLANKLSAALNIDARTLLEIRDENNSIKFRKNWVNTFVSDRQKLKDAENELDAAQAQENDTAIQAANKKIKDAKSKLTKKINKEYSKRKDTINKGVEYDRDYKSFEKLVNDIADLQERQLALYEGETNPGELNPAEIKQDLVDLNGMATQRELFVKDIRDLLTREGSSRFKRETEELRNEAIKEAYKSLYKSYTNKLIEKNLFDPEVKEEITKKVKEKLDELNKESNKLNENTPESDLSYINSLYQNISNLKLKAGTVKGVNTLLGAIESSVNLLNNKLNALTPDSQNNEAEINEISKALDYLNDLKEETFRKKKDLQSENKKDNLSIFNQILNTVDGFIRFIPKNEQGNEIDLVKALEGRTFQEIKNGLSIRIEDFEDINEDIVPLKSDGKTEIVTDVRIRNAYRDSQGNPKAIRVYLQDTLIGALTPPNKFKLEEGELELTPENIKKLNSTFSDKDVKKLLEYKQAYEELIKIVESNGEAFYEDIAKVFKFNVFSKPLNYVSIDERKALSETPEAMITLAGEKGYLIARRNSFKSTYIFIKEDGTELELSPSKNVKMFRAVAEIEQQLGNLSFDDLLQKTNNALFVVYPRPEGYSIIGLDYPKNEEATVTDEELNDIFQQAIDEFNAESDESLTEGALSTANKKGNKSSRAFRQIPLTITLAKKGLNNSIGVDVTIPLLRVKQADGTWGKATLGANIKASGASTEFMPLNIALKYSDDGIYIGDKNKMHKLSTDSLTKLVESRISFLPKNKYITEGGKNVLLKLTNAGKNSISDVSVSRIVKNEAISSKLNLQPVATPASPTVRISPSKNITGEHINIAENPVINTDTTSTEAVVETTPTEVSNNEAVQLALDMGIPSLQATGLQSIIDQKGLTIEDVRIVKAYAEKNNITDPQTLINFLFVDSYQDRASGKPNRYSDTQSDEVNDDANDDFTRLSQKEYEDNILSFNQVRDLLSNILPAGIVVKDLEDIIENLKANGEVFGAFMDNIIYLDKNKATKGLAFHEAFHAVFRTLFTEQERNEIISLALDKYGKPSKNDLKDLKESSSKYENYSEAQLTELWLEEKLADEFATYSPKNTKESWIKRIFNKIKKWLGFIKDKSISDIFEEIHRGTFKDRFIKQNKAYQNSPAFSILKTSNNRYLSLKESEIIISNLYYELLRTPDKETNFDERFEEAVKAFSTKINPVNFINNPVAYRKSNRLDMALKGEGFNLNKNYIKNEIKTRINLYNSNFNEELEEGDTTESELDSEKERVFNQDIGKYEGVKSLSKRLRTYIANTYYHNDFLGIGLDQKELEEGGWLTSVDFHVVYDNLVKILLNTPKSEFINKFYLASRKDEQLNLVFHKLMKDIYSELELDFENFNISNLPGNLDQSILFNEFYTNFYNVSLNHLSVLYDKEKGEFRLFSTNRRDVDDLQLSNWDNTLTSSSTITEESLKQAGIELTSTTATPIQEWLYPSDIRSLIENLDSYAANIQDWLSANLGMRLHIDYVRYSLLKENLKTADGNLIDMGDGNFYENSLEGAAQYHKDLGDPEGYYELIQEYINEVNSYPEDLNTINQVTDGKALLTDLIAGILKSSPKTRNPYRTKSDTLNEDGERLAGTGAVTRFKYIARANALFDTTIMSSTFRNNEGNMISNYSKPSFETTILEFLKDYNVTEFLTDLADNPGEKIWEDWKVLLNSHDMYYEDTFIKAYFNTLIHNPLLKSGKIDLFLNPSNQLQLIGGMRETVFNEDGSIDKTKDFLDGKDFKSMSEEEKLLFKMTAYVKSRENGTAMFNLSVNEAKNISYLLKLPDNNGYSSKNKVTDTFVDDMFMHFLAEVESLRTLIENPDYNIEDREKRIKFFEFNYLTEELQTSIINKLKAGESIEDSDISKIKSQIRKEAFNKIKRFNEVIQNLQLPSEFYSDKKNLDKDLINSLVLNDWINSLSYSTLTTGSDILTHKNALDKIKRNAGRVGLGPSLGTGETRITIVEDYQEIGVGNKVIDEAGDGQSYTSNWWIVDTYLKSLGKYRKELEEVYDNSGISLIDKKLLGIQLSIQETEVLKKHNALFNSKKLVGKDAQTYWKTSVHPLSVSDMAILPRKNREDAIMLLEEIKYNKFIKSDREVISNLYKELHKLYRVHENRTELWDMYTSMLEGGNDIKAFNSAIKTTTINLQSDINSRETSVVMGNSWIREQVNTDGYSENIIDGTQLLQLLQYEQPETMSEKVSQLNHYIQQRIRNGIQVKRKDLFGESGKLKPQYKKLYDVFSKSVSSSLNDPYLSAMFTLDINDNPNYDPNFAAVVSKFESLFLSFISSEGLKHKTHGRKYTLVSSYGYKVKIDKSGNVIPTNSSQKADSVRRLKYDENTGIAEVAVSSYIYRKHLKEIRENDGFIPEYLQIQLGFRIPTQDNASAIKIKVVDLLDPSMGNSIIIPPEINQLAGSDFDIDSLYAKLHNILDKEKYGKYKEIKDEKEAIKRAINEIINSKRFNEDVEFEAKVSKVENNEAFRKEYIAKRNLTPEMFKSSEYWKTFQQNRKNPKFSIPLTVEESQNEILDLQLELQFNEHAKETSEREPVLDVYKYLKANKIDTNLDFTSVHDLVSKMKAERYNAIGTKGIGPAALFNIAYQTLRYANVGLKRHIKTGKGKFKEVPMELFPELSDINKDSDIEGQWRINKVISALITAFTDNGKHFDSERLGLSINLITPTLTLVSTGVPLKDAIALVKQDFITNNKDTVKFAQPAAYNGYLKNKAKELGFTEDEIEEVFSNPKQEYGISSENLLQSLLTSQDGVIEREVDSDEYVVGQIFTNEVTNEENVDEIDDTPELQERRARYEANRLKQLKLWVDINKASVYTIQDAFSVSDEIREYTKLLSLMKGVKKSASNVIAAKEATNKLGVYVNKKGTLVKNKNKRTHINWFNVINKTRYVEENVKALYNLYFEILPEYLVSFTNGGKDLIKSVVDEGQSDRYDYEDNYNKLLGDMNSFTQLVAYRNLIKKGGEFKFDEDLFNTDFIETFNKVIDASQTDPTLQNNLLLSFIRTKDISFDNKNSVFKGMRIGFGEYNTNSKRDPDIVVALLDGFNQLISSSNEDAKKLAGLIFKQSLVKDGLKFVNGGLIRLIEPSFLKNNVIDNIPLIKDAFNGSRTYEEVFGMSKAKLRDEFVKLYSRNTKNVKEIAYIPNTKQEGKPDTLSKTIVKLNKIGYQAAKRPDAYVPKDSETKKTTDVIIREGDGKGNILAININLKVAPNIQPIIQGIKKYFNDTIKSLPNNNTKMHFPRVIKIGRDYFQLVTKQGIVYTPKYISDNARYERIGSAGNKNILMYGFTTQQIDEFNNSIAENSTEAVVVGETTDSKKVVPEFEDADYSFNREEDKAYYDKLISPQLYDTYNSSLNVLDTSMQEMVESFINSDQEMSLQDFFNKFMEQKGKEKYKFSKKLNLDYKTTLEQYSNLEELIEIANALSDKFNIPYEISEKYNSKGTYANGKVYINPKLYTKDTPFHEFSHPFVESIRLANSELYNNLIKDLEGNTRGIELIEAVKTEYPNLKGTDLTNEIITTALGINAAEFNNKSLSSKLRIFWNKIRNLLKKLFTNPEMTILVADLDADTSFTELALMLNTDNKISLAKNASEIKNELNTVEMELSDNTQSIYKHLKELSIIGEFREIKPSKVKELKQYMNELVSEINEYNDNPGNELYNISETEVNLEGSRPFTRMTLDLNSEVLNKLNNIKTKELSTNTKIQEIVLKGIGVKFTDENNNDC